MTDSPLEEICLIVATRNLLAKRRQVIRDRRRNYNNRDRAYCVRNEQAMYSISLELKALSNLTTLKLRRRLTRIGAGLWSDGQAGIRAIAIQADYIGKLDTYLKKIAISNIADKFAMEILSENALLGAKHKWLKLAKYYTSLK